MEFPKRKRTRLVNFDYSQDGFYFVTICSHEHRQIFSRIVGRGLAPAETFLSAYGMIAKKQLLALEERYPFIRIHKYVIMPNHIHLILSLHSHSAGASPCPTLSDVICTFKSLTSRECRGINPSKKIFQASFHDHIIRGEADYLKIWEYIDTNPQKWCFDRYYSDL